MTPSKFPSILLTFSLLVLSVQSLATVYPKASLQLDKTEHHGKKSADDKDNRKEKPLVAPDIDLKDISILSISFDAVGVGIDLSVDNPNEEEIVVEEINYSLKLDKTLVKSGKIEQVERFPAMAKRDVHVPVILPFDENVPSILSAIRNMSANYEIFGSVKIKGRKEALAFSHRSRLSSLN